jgi:multiple sugar transport system substrate-binding protein
MSSKRFTRRDMLRLSGVAAASTVLAACAPKIVTVTQIVEKSVEKIVEKPVEKIVKETVIVQGTPKIVEKLITAAPQPVEKKAAEVSIMMWAGELSDDELKQYNADHAPYVFSRLDPDQVRFYAMYAAGNPPDIYRVQAPEVPGLMARGITFDLTPYFETSKYLKIDDLGPACSFYMGNSPLDIGKGKIWGMVKDWSPDCTLWVNKLLFQKAGVDVPSETAPMTYAQVMDLGEKLTKKEGDRTLVWGFDWGHNWEERYWEVWLEANGMSLFSNDFSKFQFQGVPEAMACAKYMFDLMQAGTAQSPLSPSPRGWQGPDFLAGQIAMQQYGFWFSGMVTGTANTETGMEGENKGQAIMIPAPIWGDKGKRISTTITATGYVAAKITKSPDAMWDAFEWFSAREPAMTRAKGGWGVPALKSLYQYIPEYNEERKQIKRVLLEEMKYSDWVVRFNPFLKGGEPAAVGASWGTHLEAALKGDITFEQLVGTMQEEIDTAIKEGMDRIM